MNEDLKKTIAKIKRGDGLTEQELDKSLEFFKEMTQGLEILGPTFHLPWKECYSLFNMLTGFKEARMRDKPKPKAVE